MSISNKITDIIYEMLEKDGTVEIKRNDFAKKVGCAPSQINYVISKRFIPELGYFVESQRGSGGYIKISKVVLDNKNALKHALNSIGDSLDPLSARNLVSNLVTKEIIDSRIAEIIMAVLSDYSLKDVSPELRDYTRAKILKNTLLVCGKDD